MGILQTNLSIHPKFHSLIPNSISNHHELHRSDHCPLGTPQWRLGPPPGKPNCSSGFHKWSIDLNLTLLSSVPESSLELVSLLLVLSVQELVSERCSVPSSPVSPATHPCVVSSSPTPFWDSLSPKPLDSSPLWCHS